MAKLTTKSVEAAKPMSVRREVPDGLVVGLYLIIQPSGAKSWAIRYRHANKPKKMTLGPLAPELEGPEPDPVLGAPLTLKGARQVAREQLQLIAAGRDPAEERKAAVKTANEPVQDTVRQIGDLWLKTDQASNRSYSEVKRVLNYTIYPEWGDRSIRSISRGDAAKLIDGIASRGAVTMGRRTQAHLHRMFRWAVGKGHVDTNPVADLEKPGKPVKRDRVLSDDELADAWRASRKLGWPFCQAVRLLILTAARREEVGGLRWSEVNRGEASIKLSGQRTKNGEARVIPLSVPAMAVIDSLPQVLNEDGKAVFALTTTGRSPVSGWSKAKRMLDAAIADDRLSAADDPATVEPVPEWRIHDIRRTTATGLQRLGFGVEVVETVLGHTSGSRAGVIGIYQRHQFGDEARDALDAWGRYVTLIARARVWGRVRDHLDALDIDPEERPDVRRERHREFNRMIRGNGKAWTAYVRGIARPVEAAENVVKLHA